MSKNCTVVKLISWIHFITELDDLSIRVFEKNVLPKCGGLFPLHIRHFRRTVFSVRNPNQKQILIIKENIFELNELITVIITYYK